MCLPYCNYLWMRWSLFKEFQLELLSERYYYKKLINAFWANKLTIHQRCGIKIIIMGYNSKALWCKNNYFEQGPPNCLIWTSIGKVCGNYKWKGLIVLECMEKIHAWVVAVQLWGALCHLVLGTATKEAKSLPLVLLTVHNSYPGLSQLHRL